MSTASDADRMAAVVAELRAAGCVFAEDEARLLLSASETSAALDDMVRRRTEGEPLEVILGWAEFCELRIAVDARVFVPRERTRFLVDLAVEIARPGAVVLDLCCGTGAIGAAMAARLGAIELYAVDIDPAAVRCARRNLAAAGGRVCAGDLFEPLPASLLGRVDVLAVNAPYVPTDEIAMMPPEARDHEPWGALDGGPDGVDVHRRIAKQAARWLAPAGSLLIETSEHQAPLTSGAMVAGGLVPRVETSEELYCTVVIGTKRNP
jgi:release factor glutamine methyltransferase